MNSRSIGSRGAAKTQRRATKPSLLTVAQIVNLRSPGKRSAPGKECSAGAGSRVRPMALPGLPESSAFAQVSIIEKTIWIYRNSNGVH